MGSVAGRCDSDQEQLLKGVRRDYMVIVILYVVTAACLIWKSCAAWLFTLRGSCCAACLHSSRSFIVNLFNSQVCLVNLSDACREFVPAIYL